MNNQMMLYHFYRWKMDRKKFHELHNLLRDYESKHDFLEDVKKFKKGEKIIVSNERLEDIKKIEKNWPMDELESFIQNFYDKAESIYEDIEMYFDEAFEFDDDLDLAIPIKEGKNEVTLYDKQIEIYLNRDLQLETIIEEFKEAGSNVFNFSADLISLLEKTSVNDVPALALTFPFNNFFVKVATDCRQLGVFENFILDGFYVRVENGIEDILQSVEYEIDNNIVDSKHSLFNIYFNNKSTDDVRAIIKTYRDNPLEFDYSDEPFSKFEYLTVAINFVFVAKKKLTEEQMVISEPYIFGNFNFKTPKSSIREAYLEAESSLKQHADEFSKNPSDAVLLPDITDHKKLLRRCLKLVFNILLYFSSNEKLISTYYPSKKVQQKLINTKSNKQKEKIESKAKNSGFVKVNYCGLKKSINQSLSDNGISSEVSPHWRRGHWRFQAFGEKYARHKVIWIKPTIVRKDIGQPTQWHLYIMNTK